mmetsp:Transcript_5804/g.13970  ORF Transcript_5804/g.13970 Transcript_5804/m.13970 type:complete len:270 (+) Transcript_5804:1801-2610(+)
MVGHRWSREAQFLGHSELVNVPVAQHPDHPIRIPLFQIQQLSGHVQIKASLVPEISPKDEYAIGIQKVNLTVVGKWAICGGRVHGHRRPWIRSFFIDPGQNLGIVDVSIQIKLVSLNVRKIGYQNVVVLVFLYKVLIAVQASGGRGSCPIALLMCPTKETKASPWFGEQHQRRRMPPSKSPVHSPRHGCPQESTTSKNGEQQQDQCHRRYLIESTTAMKAGYLSSHSPKEEEEEEEPNNNRRSFRRISCSSIAIVATFQHSSTPSERVE